MTLFQKVQQRLSKRVEQGKVFLSFPHIKVSLCIMVLALIMLFLAFLLCLRDCHSMKRCSERGLCF